MFFFPHLPYSLDLAPSDFYLFTHLTQFAGSVHMYSDEEVVTDLLNGLAADSYSSGIHKAVIWHEKCLNFRITKQSFYVSGWPTYISLPCVPWLTAANTSSVASLSPDGSPANSAIFSNSSLGTCRISATSCCFSARASRIASSFRRSCSTHYAR